MNNSLAMLGLSKFAQFVILGFREPKVVGGCEWQCWYQCLIFDLVYDARVDEG